jgi:hypothetical protein
MNPSQSDPSNADHIRLGHAVNNDGEITDSWVVLPAKTLLRHLLITGSTGSGKSTTATWVLESAVTATEGPVIAIDPKGDWSTELARTHAARHNTLDDVLYFEGGQFLPAISYFDVRSDIQSGRARHRAVQAIANQFLDLIEHLIPDDMTAIRAPDVIEYLILALFDPVDGDDAFSIDDLVTAVQRLRETGQTPSVSAGWMTRLLAGLPGQMDQRQEQIVGGATTRVERVYGDGDLRPMFRNVAATPTDAFRFDPILDRDVLVVFDMGGLDTRGQTALANTLLSLLWRALVRQRGTTGNTPPQITIAIDEVPQLGINNRLSQLLGLSRGYGLGVVPMLQFPKQADRHSDESGLYRELLNNCHSILAGGIPADELLAKRLAVREMNEAEAQNRLGSLRQDRWLLQGALPRGEGKSKTVMIADPELPLGHPEANGSRAFSEADEELFEEVFEVVRERTLTTYGIDYEPYTYEAVADDPRSRPDFSPEVRTALQETNYRTTLPMVESLPGELEYDTATDRVICDVCGSQYAADFDGVVDALHCHDNLEDIDRENVPPIKLGLTLNDDVIRAADLSCRRLCVLQLLYNIATDTYSRVEVDLVYDSVRDKLSPLGIDSDDFDVLEDAGFIKKHSLGQDIYYTVTADGRDRLEESHRKNIAWGHGKGDLSETLVHRVLVDAIARYIQQEYVKDSDSPVVRVESYYELETADHQSDELDGKTRYDVVGLDAEAEIVVVGEAERANNDPLAALRDFDQIAAVDPEEAVWAAASSSKAHEAVIQPLSDPPEDHEAIDDSSPRIKGYSESTRVRDITPFETPGLTEIKTLTTLREAIPEPTID